MSFKLVLGTDTYRTAGETTAVGASDLDFGNLQFLQTKILKFKIANTGSDKAIFTVTIASDNTDLATNTTLSTDGTTYSTSVVYTVEANRVSGILYVKHYADPTVTAVLDEGTIKIKVVESA